MAPESIPAPLDTAALRHAFSAFATGVTIITCASSEVPVGMTANSFSSVSLDPPLLLWCCSKKAFRHPKFLAARHFSIHILKDIHSELCHRFTRGGSGFEGLNYLVGRNNVPHLPGVLARFDCSLHATHDGGDHTIFVGKVESFERENGNALCFQNGAFGTIIKL